MPTALARLKNSLLNIQLLRQSRAVQGAYDGGSAEKLIHGLASDQLGLVMDLVPLAKAQSTDPEELSKELDELLSVVLQLPESCLPGREAGEESLRESVAITILQARGFFEQPTPKALYYTWREHAERFALQGWKRAFLQMVQTPEQAKALCEGGWKSTGNGIGARLSGSSRWAWNLHNFQSFAIERLCQLGAGEAFDKQGRPALAYARSDRAARALLEKGDDPLNASLGFGARLRALSHLCGEGDKSSFIEVGAVRQYVREAVATWSAREKARLSAWIEYRFQELLPNVKEHNSGQKKAMLEHVRAELWARADLPKSPAALVKAHGQDLALPSALFRSRLLGTNFRPWGLRTSDKAAPMRGWNYLEYLLSLRGQQSLCHASDKKHGAWKDVRSAIEEISASPSVTNEGWNCVVSFWKTQWSGALTLQEQAKLIRDLCTSRIHALSALGKDWEVQGMWPGRMISFLTRHGPALDPQLRAQSSGALLAMLPRLEPRASNLLKKWQLERLAQWTGEGLRAGYIAEDDPAYATLSSAWLQRDPAGAARVEELIIAATLSGPAPKQKRRM